ncbi:F0F1 ATP synthase subunit epsilon [Candidatus Profftella armatura]|uniref:ATP synthase epsilon chain n=1 Tax=Candidatus Profftella armatura TaxID=669502 RepID=S5R3W9_9PROT|nr:F0F1 ATP synthase subunit epsilon [Candidatus Profftella armatura]AGS06899.1 F0F1 ATP synthase subunit epsilon [Candidatus Profftella armatura]ALC95981.1 hypothetical protein AMC77_01085 [Candidatus Profftella armatura]QLK13808.1 F0F1 ATP synthase subunit epsilon [Candidatus Profftella armatura]
MTIHAMRIDIVSIEGLLFSNKNIEFIVLPGELGDLGVYPLHSPLITCIKPGFIRIKISKKIEEKCIFVSGGIIDIQPDSVIVLADTAIHGSDLVEKQIEKEKILLENILYNKKSNIDYSITKAKLAIIIAQLKTIQYLRFKKYK